MEDEHPKMSDLIRLIESLRTENEQFKEEIKRLNQLLNGEDIIKNSLGKSNKS
jgi:cell division septum initiation protein DivIVA